jgi:hypothetical protein
VRYAGVAQQVRAGDLFTLMINRMKELTVKRKGILTEEELKLWFLKEGYSVSVPIGDDDRYDFIVDFDGKLVKIQSKTSNLTRTPGCLNFACASIKYNSQGSHRTKYTKDEIDYFCTIHPETQQVYIIPVEECGNEFDLRLIPPKNNNYSKCHMAVNYEGEKMIERILNS